MKRIFGSILSAKLADFENEVRLMGDNLMLVCIGVYTEVVKELLPTPSKSHYVFNMRDLAKVRCKPPRVALCYSSITFIKVKLDMFTKIWTFWLSQFYVWIHQYFSWRYVNHQ